MVPTTRDIKNMSIGEVPARPAVLLGPIGCRPTLGIKDAGQSVNSAFETDAPLRTLVATGAGRLSVRKSSTCCWNCNCSVEN